MAVTRRIHVWIRGRVQGVFYRQSAVEEARRRALNGWIRNLQDGRVEAVVEGPRAEVESWLAWSRQGPPAAHVDEIRVEDEQPTGETAFVVAPTGS